MIVWNVAFNIAYKNGQIKSIEAVQDEAGARLIAGTLDEFNAAKRLPEFATFLQAIGVGGIPYLPADVESYDFRFTSITTNGHINVCGSSDAIDGAVVINDPAVFTELTSNASFNSYFASASTVLINTDFVDYDPGNSSAEASNLIAGLELFGRTVTTFTNVDAAGVAAAIEGVSHLIIPELEKDSLIFSPEAAAVIRNYVSSGNTFIAFYTTQRMRNMVNELFDWSISEGSEGSGTYLKTAEAEGQGFGSAPSSIPVENATAGVALNSLPPGGVPIYKEDSDSCAIVRIPYGQGHVIIFAWDWYNAFPVGDNNDGWLVNLDIATQ